MNKKLLLLLSFALAVLLAAGGWWWWRSEAISAAVIAGIPKRPNLASWNPELQQRVSAAESKARRGPDQVAALVELARLYHANGFFDEASVCYQALMEADASNPRWAHALATILAGYGKLDEATALWSFVVARAPDFALGQTRLGDVLLKANRFDEAIAPYTAALKRDPGNPYALVGLARIDIEKGRWQAARENLERAAEKSKSAIGTDLLVTVYEKLGLEDQALMIRGRDKAAGTYFDPPDPWVDDMFFDCYDLYRLTIAAGVADHGADYSTAKQLLDRALILDPKHVHAMYQLGSIYLKTGESAKAFDLFKRCTETDPAFQDGWAYLIFLYSQRGDNLGAELALAQGLRHCPKSPGLHLEKGRRLVKAGRFEEALAEFDLNASLRPEEGQGHLEAGMVLARMNRVTEAIERLSLALKAEPGLPGALSTLAMAYISINDEAKARKAMKQVSLQPRIPAEQRSALEQAFRQQFGRNP